MGLCTVSFDLDGTLVDDRFVEAVWFEGVPTLFAEDRGVPFDEALRLVVEEYDSVGPKRLEWYNLDYWLRRFNLREEPKSLLYSFRGRLSLYPDTLPALRRLYADGYRLIVVTSAARDFVDIALGHTGLSDFIDEVFSAPSDFQKAGKDEELFAKVLEALALEPQCLYHVGDNRVFDFEVPRELGIEAFLLDRRSAVRGEYIVSSLEEFVERVQGRRCSKDLGRRLF